MLTYNEFKLMETLIENEGKEIFYAKDLPYNPYDLPHEKVQKTISVSLPMQHMPEKGKKDYIPKKYLNKYYEKLSGLAYYDDYCLKEEYQDLFYEGSLPKVEITITAYQISREDVINHLKQRIQDTLEFQEILDKFVETFA